MLRSVDRLMSSHSENHSSIKPGTILVADDDANDVFFLKRAFKKAGYDYKVLDVPDGERAIQYLSGSDAFSDRSQFPLPSLLILDLKMPKVNGFEVLAWIKEQSSLNTMKVVVLSSSGLQSDKQKAETLGAHDYRVKPGDIGDMVNMVKDVAVRWMA
jgi:DNA-binding response OmpR family regulator